MPRQSVINTRTQYISSFLKRKRFIFQLSTDLTKFQNIFCKLGECQELPDDICSGLQEFICRLYNMKKKILMKQDTVFTKKLHNENKIRFMLIWLYHNVILFSMLIVNIVRMLISFQKRIIIATPDIPIFCSHGSCTDSKVQWAESIFRKTLKIITNQVLLMRKETVIPKANDNGEYEILYWQCESNNLAVVLFFRSIQTCLMLGYL